jgi:hypothetical protein
MDFMFLKKPFKMKVMQGKCQGDKNYVPSEIKYTKLTLCYIKMQSTSMA